MVGRMDGAVLATIWSLMLRSLPPWHQALEFFKPIQDDVHLAGASFYCLDQKKAGAEWRNMRDFSTATSEAKEHIFFAAFGDHYLDVLYQSVLALDQRLQFRRTQVLLEMGSQDS